MRILHQNLIASISVLLLLVIITAVASDRLERAEMVRGVEGEASSLAVALSKFIEEEVGNSQGTGETISPPSCDRIKKAFGTIRRYNPSVLVALYSPEGKRLLCSSEDYHPVSLPAQALSMVQAGEVVIVPGMAGVAAMSCAGVWSSNKELVAVVKVITRPAELAVFLQRLNRRTVFLGLLALLLGMGVACFLSARLGREIDSLRASPQNSWRQVQETGRGKQWFSIREIEDLRNTLDTIESVMEETDSRATRSRAEEGHLHMVQDPCSEMGADIRRPHDISVGGVCLSLRPVGVPPRGEFSIAGKQGKDLYAFAGRVNDSIREDAGLTASAARTLLEDLLSRHDPAASQKTLMELFHLESALGVVCQADAKTVRVFSGRSGASTLTEKIFALKGESPIVVHDLTDSDALSALVEGIVSVYDGLSCSELADRCAYALSHEGSGTVLVVTGA